MLARRVGMAASLSAIVAIAGCNGGSSVSSTLPAVTYNYTAIGASDAVGVGAVQCTTSGTPPQPNPANCPGGTGYVPDVAGDLTALGAHVNLVDRGISGAVLAADIQTEGDMFDPTNACKPRSGAGLIPGNFTDNLLSQVPANSTIVTVFAGGNDTNALTGALGCLVAGGLNPAGQTAFVQTWITNFGNDYATLIAGIKSKAPAARIIVGNLPNFANIPVGKSQTTATRTALQAFSVGFDTNVINKLTSQGILVVDLLCDSRSYDANNFFVDGFHPNATGYSIFAQIITQAIVSPSSFPSPAASCPQMTLQSASRTPLGLKLPLNY